MNGTHEHNLETFNYDLASTSKMKLVTILFLMFFSSFIATFNQLVALYLVLGIVVVSSRPNMKNIMVKLLIPLPLLITLYIVTWFSSTTIQYSTILGKTTFDQIGFSSFIFLRSVLILSFILIYIESESFYTFIYILDDFHFPSKLVSTIFLLYRNIFIIQKEFQRILDAQYNRSYQKPNYFSLSYLRLVGNIIGSTFVRSFIRAENQAYTLKSKRFQGNFPHEKIVWNHKDVYWLFLLFLAFYLVITNLDTIFKINYM